MGDLAAAVDGPAPRRRPTWMRLLLWAGWLAVALLAGLVLVRGLGWQAGPLVPVVALLPWFALLGLVAVVPALVARAWLLLGAAVALLVVLVAWQLPLYVADGPAQGSPVMKVASVNMTLGRADAGAVVDLVREQGVDVLSLQELTPTAVTALEAAGLDELLPHRDVRPSPGASGSGLWSRYPMTSSSRLDGFMSAFITAQVTTPVGPMTVFAVHPDAPGQYVHDRWAGDLARLRDVLAAAPGPVLVAGDFNSTRDHVQFREIEALGYRDAADQAGAGFLPTFPEGRGPWPLVAIDHVMVRGTPLQATGVTTTAIPGADHLALVVSYSREAVS